MSDDNVLSRANRQKISPESTAAIQRNDRNWLRGLRISGTRVKVRREKVEVTDEEADEPSDQERKVYKKDNKMPKNKRYRRQ